MTTLESTITFDSSTDALFRVWVARLGQAFLDAGLVRHTDTGQINVATATVNRGQTNQVDNFIGYEVFRFNDTLQATRPIFVKVEYGISNHYNNYYGGYQNALPTVWVTVGTATNGAGTITGIVGTRHRWFGNTAGSWYWSAGPVLTAATPSAGTPLHVCGLQSKGYMGIALGVTNQQQPFYALWGGGGNMWSSFPAFFIIERTHDSTGNPTGDGFHVLTCHWPTDSSNNIQGARPTYQTFSFMGGSFTVSPQDTYWPIAMPGQNFSTANFDGDSFFYPLPMATPKPQAQSLAVLGTFKADVPLRSVQEVTVLGEVHYYLSCAGIAGTAATDNTRSRFWDSIPNGAFLMRWE